MWPDGVDDDLGSPGGSIRHAFLASAWRRDPVVRLTYEPGDDVLVAEIGPGEGPETVEVHPDLVVQFVGAGGWPVLVSLAGARGAVGTALGSVVDEVIGPRAWAVAQRLVTVGGPAAEVTAAEVDLDGDDVAALEATWVGLAERLRATAVPPARVEPRPDDRVVGVEVLPREVRAGMVDLRGRVSGVRTVALDSGSPAEVRGAVEKLLGDIGGDAVVGLQIGGPVDSEAGVVRHYGKQVDGGEWPKQVSLGHDLETSTRRTVTVVNDAQALAHWEVEFGLGATESTFAVLLVGQGVGARYVHDGQVRPYGMEVGMFVPNLGLRSVEEEAGTSAMMRTIREELGIEVASFAEAAELVDEHEDEAIPKAVLELFRKAGRDIATGMGAAQAILDPRSWALHVPPPLDELDSALGEAFRDGVSTIDDRVRYTDLHKPVLVVRAVDGDTGIAAAATAARHLTGRRVVQAAGRDRC